MINCNSAVFLLIHFKFLVTEPIGKELRFCPNARTADAVSLPAISTSGFNTKGPAESYGTGSTEITSVRHLTSKRNVTPYGSFSKKFSQATSCLADSLLYGVTSNTVLNAVNAPVHNPEPPITHPSYI